MDFFSRKIVGWTMAPTMPAELVCSALQMAIAQRCTAPGLIVHSDGGSQYASEAYRCLLERHGLRASMGRKGNCWDNAVMERFFLNLKMERVWQCDYANHAEAARDVTEYISVSTTACACIRNWAICHPPLMSGKGPQNTLSG